MQTKISEIYLDEIFIRFRKYNRFWMIQIAHHCSSCIDSVSIQEEYGAWKVSLDEAVHNAILFRPRVKNEVGWFFSSNSATLKLFVWFHHHKWRHEMTTCLWSVPNYRKTFLFLLVLSSFSFLSYFLSWINNYQSIVTIMCHNDELS